MTTAAAHALAGVVAESPAMKELVELVQRLAETRSPVLLEGESGTGKDLIAHWLHYGGPRRDGPFLKIHCPSIPSELLESELFGHEKGAFTDARQAKAGKIEMAAGGTLYFDQIQDLAPAAAGEAAARGRGAPLRARSAARARSRSTCASSPRRTSTSPRPCARAASARTSTTA